MATLDISEHRKPQDGKIDFARFGGPKVELRVATIPTHQGLEDMVLREVSGDDPPHLWRRVGCPHCEHSGYKGRMGIYELMPSSDDIRAHIRQRAPARDIRASALQAGMKTLRQDGIEKVLLGLTDLAEVLAAANM